MRTLMKWLAPSIFVLAFAFFRSSLFKSSRRKHSQLMRVFRFAADNDSQQALSVYGHMLHFRGEGVENRIQGGIYLQRAADKGDMKAQYQMGKIYEAGFEHYFPPSNDKSLHYYQLAASQGHALAISRLISVYQTGELDQMVDDVKVKHWQEKQPALPVI
ncbi:tetratricopeptide repeat protein [Neptunomonas antarctica]|uniref:Sel1 repeat-containing protein n=1 Tax=Neptunomonas antarctica TaxID=619304 RepID=A0A1N7NMD6_9GAMM|nr:SEL1-like repeat protein [Neptunomonas antarctica]SIS99349.1 Sel1 repeat-containing protein [Neptunomonas antarctica]